MKKKANEREKKKEYYRFLVRIFWCLFRYLDVLFFLLLSRSLCFSSLFLFCCFQAHVSVDVWKNVCREGAKKSIECLYVVISLCVCTRLCFSLRFLFRANHHLVPQYICTLLENNSASLKWNTSSVLIADIISSVTQYHWQRTRKLAFEYQSWS